MTRPRNTANRHHLQPLIGQLVTVQLVTERLPGTLSPIPDTRHALVRVLDVATPYGAPRLLITPAAGEGEAWISADKLIDWPGRTDTITPQRRD